MNVFWNTYEPALTDKEWTSSTGDGMWLTHLWSELRKARMQVFNVSVGLYDDRVDYYENVLGSVKPDVIVLSWRWPMPDYHQRQQAYLRQMDLIEFATKRKVPVLIHNSNLMPNMEDAAIWAKHLDFHGCRVRLTAPLMCPPKDYRTLHFVYPPKKARAGGYRSRERVYVGNNYGRYNTALEWLRGVPVVIHGNWLEPSPHRQSPEQVIKDFGTGPAFMPKISQKDVLKALTMTWATVHLAKPDYYKYGFMAYRWAEAAQAGTYAFVPHEMNMREEAYDMFSSDVNQWRAPFDDQAKSKMTYAVAAQRKFVESMMSVQPWFDVLKELSE
jgi:hypothetical protein